MTVDRLSRGYLALTTLLIAGACSGSGEVTES
jgi:hypothetical protein